MKILAIAIIIILASTSLCNAKFFKSYKYFSIENYKNYTTHDIPINTAEEALAYANKENAFEKADLNDLEKRGYKTFRVEVYQRTSKHISKFFEKRYKNGLDSKDDLKKHKIFAENIGDHWQVKLHASGLIPSYSCDFYVKPTGEIVLPGWSGCGFNK